MNTATICHTVLAAVLIITYAVLTAITSRPRVILVQ